MQAGCFARPESSIRAIMYNDSDEYALVISDIRV